MRILGRYETRKGVQSPPKATGFPSKDTSMRETASATDDMSSTLKIQETYLHAYTLYYSVNIHNIKKGLFPFTFVSHCYQDTISVI